MESFGRAVSRLSAARAFIAGAAGAAMLAGTVVSMRPVAAFEDVAMAQPRVQPAGHGGAFLPQVQAGKVDRGSLGLRKAYAARTGADAQMDVNFGFVGYAAAGAGSGSPYRPTATVAVRLVSPDGKQNYYTDYYAYNNVFNIKKASRVVVIHLQIWL